MLFSINDISTGSLKIICTKDICNSAVGLNTALLQIYFFWQGNLWKYWSEIVRFFVGYPKICLFYCFANNCVSPETPKRGILFLGHPVAYQVSYQVARSALYSIPSSKKWTKLRFCTCTWWTIDTQKLMLISMGLGKLILIIVRTFIPIQGWSSEPKLIPILIPEVSRHWLNTIETTRWLKKNTKHPRHIVHFT